MIGDQTGLFDLQPIALRHKALPEEVFDVLSEAILAGTAQQGEQLNETELARRMGISRAPVREALAELVNQGLAVRVPRKGTFVARWEKRDLWEVATLRSVMEGLAAKHACSNIEPADIQFLKGVIRRMEAADREGDMRQLLDLDQEFHGRRWECARHKRLQRCLQDHKLQIRVFRIVTRDTDVIGYPRQHQILLDAVRSQDPDLAQQRAIEHVMDTASLALQDLSDDDVWERVAAFAADEQVERGSTDPLPQPGSIP